MIQQECLGGAKVIELAKERNNLGVKRGRD